MNQPTETSSETDTLLEALLALAANPLPPPDIEHRVYYDVDSRECVFKTTEKPPGAFKAVTREEYDAIAFCPQWQITPTGRLMLIPVDTTSKIMLECNKTAGYRTLRDNNIFRVDEGYLAEADYWTLGGSYNDE